MSVQKKTRPDNLRRRLFHGQTVKGAHVENELHQFREPSLLSRKGSLYKLYKYDDEHNDGGGDGGGD